MSENKISVSPELVNRIRTELVEKNYYEDVAYNIKSKSRWKIIADITEAIARILSGVSVVLAFAAGFFNYMLLSFISGCFGTLALVLLHFSSYSMNESKERTEQVNRILAKIGIDTIADITIDSTNAKLESVFVDQNNANVNSSNTLVGRKNTSIDFTSIPTNQKNPNPDFTSIPIDQLMTNTNFQDMLVDQNANTDYISVFASEKQNI